jgi:hypothetical protein
MVYFDSEFVIWGLKKSADLAWLGRQGIFRFIIGVVGFWVLSRV